MGKADVSRSANTDMNILPTIMVRSCICSLPQCPKIQNEQEAHLIFIAFENISLISLFQTSSERPREGAMILPPCSPNTQLK